MLKSIIRTLLQKFIDDIDSDNCNITMEQQSKIISVLSNIANPDYRMSKVQACAEQIVKHGKKLMHCLSELESKSGEHYMERYGKRRRGGMRDSDYDDEDYPRYY